MYTFIYTFRSLNSFAHIYIHRLGVDDNKMLF